jgi:hypothetical protein
MTVTEGLQRFGLLLPPQRRASVVLAGTAEEVGGLYPATDAALRLRPGYRLVLAAPSADAATLGRRYLHETVLPLPHPIAAGCWRRRLDTRLVIGSERLKWLAGDIAFVDGGAAILPARMAQALPLLDQNAVPPVRAFLVDLLGGRPIRSLGDLKARLGDPRTIVCLGNGPSSEDPKLAAYHGATLFRVNWNFRRRRWMTAPHVVFTADADLPPLRRRPIVVFPTAATGRPILLRHTLMLRPPTSGYAFLDEFDPALAELSGPVIPTNGALMIAVAAALRPEKIVIAGMDLYRHASGRYPGEDGAVDGYAREHSRDVDLGLIRAALSGFDGEAVHLSENLRKALGSGADKK